MPKIRIPFVFRIPKVYTWEDVRRQILENMEREGLPTEGISAGSTGTYIINVTPPMSEVGTATDVSIKITTAAGHFEADSDYFAEAFQAKW